MAEKSKQAVKKKTDKTEKLASSSRTPRPLKGIGGYFSGAWYELRQVRWPNRRATWSLTFAVLVFTAFFSALILLLDYLFQILFKEILL